MHIVTDNTLPFFTNDKTVQPFSFSVVSGALTPVYTEGKHQYLAYCRHNRLTYYVSVTNLLFLAPGTEALERTIRDDVYFFQQIACTFSMGTLHQKVICWYGYRYTDKDICLDFVLSTIDGKVWWQCCKEGRWWCKGESSGSAVGRCVPPRGFAWWMCLCATNSHKANSKTSTSWTFCRRSFFVKQIIRPPPSIITRHSLHTGSNGVIFLRDILRKSLLNFVERNLQSLIQAQSGGWGYEVCSC